MTVRSAEARAERARSLGPTDLVLSHMTLPRTGFAERVEAAAAAGFAGIGLHVAGWKRLRREGATVADLGRVLDGCDQVLVEVEFLQGWDLAEGAGRERARDAEDLAFELIDGLGARHLQLGGPHAGDVDRAAEAFARICDRAAGRGVLVALEYLPEMTNIETVGQALAVVEGAGRPNGGVCVDSWHHERGADTLEDLAAVPGRRIASVQLDDGPAQRGHPDYTTDTSTNRLAPGEGDFDLVGLVRTLRAAGVAAPLGLEVISNRYDGLEAAAVVRRVADGMRAVLARAALVP